VASLYTVKMHLLAGWVHVVLLHTPEEQRSLKVPVRPSLQGVPLGLFTSLVQRPARKSKHVGVRLQTRGRAAVSM
jgi:hypothetical protein